MTIIGKQRRAIAVA